MYVRRRNNIQKNKLFISSVNKQNILMTFLPKYSRNYVKILFFQSISFLIILSLKNAFTMENTFFYHLNIEHLQKC